MQARSLTSSVKAKRTPLIIERDYPNGEEPTCCYCEQRFINNTSKWKKTWEHLDNDETNEELWNLMWAHWYCNQKKKYFIDYQIMAQDLIKKNQEWQNTFNTTIRQFCQMLTYIHSSLNPLSSQASICITRID